MTTVYYFAYGSNMSRRRLRARLPEAEPVANGTAAGYEIIFHKIGSVDGSGKCGLRQCPRGVSRVPGVVFRIHSASLPRLDELEGVGNGYERIELTVHLPGREAVTAVSYLATHLKPGLLPFHWYKQHVLVGAREHRLPADHIRLLEALESIEDPDSDRAAREESLYLPEQID